MEIRAGKKCHFAPAKQHEPSFEDLRPGEAGLSPCRYCGQLEYGQRPVSPEEAAVLWFVGGAS